MNEPVMIRQDRQTSTLIFADGSAETETRKAVSILEEKCLKHGSSLKGRIDSFRYLLHIVQKPAVLISEVSGEIWFPLISMNQPDCIWLRYDAVLDVKSSGDHQCEVLFFSGHRETLAFDPRVIRLQMKRCRQFLELLHQ